MESHGVLNGLMMLSADDSLTNTPVEKTPRFIWKNGLCAQNISVKDRWFLQIQNLPANIYIPLKIVIADKNRSPYYMLDDKTVVGEPIELAAGTFRYYSISFE